MENQEQELEQNNQQEQTAQNQNTPNQNAPNQEEQHQDASIHQTGVIPDDELEGSDADADELMKDTDEVPEEDGDEEQDFDTDESTGGTAI
jgi:hypothetical protein